METVSGDWRKNRPYLGSDAEYIQGDIQNKAKESGLNNYVSLKLIGKLGVLSIQVNKYTYKTDFLKH
jgi:hypothetical protein